MEVFAGKMAMASIAAAACCSCRPDEIPHAADEMIQRERLRGGAIDEWVAEAVLKKGTSFQVKQKWKIYSDIGSMVLVYMLTLGLY